MFSEELKALMEERQNAQRSKSFYRSRQGYDECDAFYKRLDALKIKGRGVVPMQKPTVKPLIIYGKIHDFTTNVNGTYPYTRIEGISSIRIYSTKNEAIEAGIKEQNKKKSSLMKDSKKYLEYSNQYKHKANLVNTKIDYLTSQLEKAKEVEGQVEPQQLLDLSTIETSNEF